MTAILSLIAAGFVLLFAEIFLPGLVAGIIGVVCLLAAVAMTGIVYGAPAALGLFGGLAFIGFIGFLFWMKFFPSSRFGRRLSLQSISGQAPDSSTQESLIGQIGETVTALRPSGTAVFNHKRQDVITEGSHIEALTKIKVVKVEGPRILVRKI